MSDDAPANRLQITARHAEETYPAQPAAVAAIRRRCVLVAASLGATDVQQEHVMLTTSEAAANAVLYAYPHFDGEILLRTRTPEPGVLEIVIADTGVGLGNAGRPGGLGQGLAIMDQLADGFRVSSEPGAGTTVLLTFRLG